MCFPVLPLLDGEKIAIGGLELNILKNENKLTYVNLYPEKFADKRTMVSYIQSDITKLNIEDDTFDVVTCISVLEHIGFNNEIYDTSGKKNIDFIIILKFY